MSCCIAEQIQHTSTHIVKTQVCLSRLLPCTGKRPACRRHYVRVEQSDSQVSNSSHYMYTVSKERLYSQPPTTAHTLHISPLYQNYQQSAVVASFILFFFLSSFFFFVVWLSLSSIQPDCFVFFFLFSVRRRTGSEERVWPLYRIYSQEPKRVMQQQESSAAMEVCVMREGGEQNEERSRKLKTQTWRHVTHTTNVQHIQALLLFLSFF